jgi:RNA polymerase sigma-70 factor (ECF subfamily)
MSGDEWGGLYKRYQSFVQGRCLRLLGDRAAAEDATQETFLRLRGREHEIPESVLPGWLHRVATNYCLNELRRRRTQAEPADVMPEVVDPAFDEARVANLDLAKRIIARAPSELGETAWLYHCGDLDQDQVAQAMGISRRSVVNYLVRFRTFAQRYARNNVLTAD